MSSFNKMLQKCRDRDWGGTSDTYSCEPYVSGYGFIKWYLPDSLSYYLSKYSVQVTNQQTQSLQSVSAAETGLSAACIGVTPQSHALDFVEYYGATGVKWKNPDKITYGNTINIKYLEMSGLPIQRIHKCWIEMIRENKAGQKIDVKYKNELMRNNWSGAILYWTTKPDGVTVENFAFYSGVVSSRDAQDVFGFDIQTVDKVELDYEYSIDYIWNDPWVYDMAVKMAKKKPYGATGATRWSADGFRKSETIVKKEFSNFQAGGPSKASPGAGRAFS